MTLCRRFWRWFTQTHWEGGEPGPSWAETITAFIILGALGVLLGLTTGLASR